MIPLQSFRQALPNIAFPSASSIELYLATCTQVLQHFSSRDSWVNYLPADEQERAQSFRLEADRLRFVAARLLLRCRLSQLGMAPDCWQFTTNKHGKPFLCDPPLSDNLVLPHFNLAHSGDYIALAFSHDFELGLDVEQQSRTRPNIAGIAEMLFTKEEQEKLHSLLQYDEIAAQDLFVTFWCRYEALSKLEGTGLLSSIDNLSRDKIFSFTEGRFNYEATPYFWALCWQSSR